MVEVVHLAVEVVVGLRFRVSVRQATELDWSFAAIVIPGFEMKNVLLISLSGNFGPRSGPCLELPATPLLVFSHTFIHFI